MGLPAETEAALLPPPPALFKGPKTIHTPDGDQQIYCEEYGNRNGEPVFVLHGGPGYGTSEFYARYFDPNFYHIILFDQRGAKRSTPGGNDPEALGHISAREMMEDINRLAEQGFGIDFERGDKIHLMGGSWGSILGLYYGAHYPERLHSLTVRATTLGVYDTLAKMHGLEADGVTPRLKSAVPPELWEACKGEWERFFRFIRQEAPQARDPVEGYYFLLTNPHTDPAIRQEAAKRWILFEHMIGDSSQTPAEIEKEVDAMGADHQLPTPASRPTGCSTCVTARPAISERAADPHYNFFDDPEGVVRADGTRARGFDQLARIEDLHFVRGRTTRSACPPTPGWPSRRSGMPS
ncbi:MAG: alpha/beta fold hydrolase [Alphaproteobacteria bacterium]